jgi:hypothetical protein
VAPNVNLIAGIVGGIGGALLLAGVISIIIYFIQKNRNKEEQTYFGERTSAITADVEITTTDKTASSLPMDYLSQGS